MTQSTQPAIELLPATAADYPDILELNAAAVPHVNLIDEQTLLHLHDQSESLMVARKQDSLELEGFLLTLADGADYDSLNYQYFSARYASFVYVDRIVVRPDRQRLGIGRRFYERLFALADGRPVTCEVNIEPPNEQSMRFHHQLGFTRVGEQATEGGSKRVALLARISVP